MGMRLAGALALVLGTVAFAAPAFAGNGSGNGNSGKADSSGAASAPGNSAGAPGQLKKDEAASTDAPDSAPPTTTITTATSAAASTSQSASSQGVKPANDTAHDTHAAASSTKTKLYGNGQTAGQIAIKNGARASTVLHGPGNSQPHKAAPCSGGHEVDVHALKSRRHRGSCGSEPTPTPKPTPHPGHESGPGGGPEQGSDPGSSPSGGTTVMAQPAAKTVSRPTSSRGSGATLAAVGRTSSPTLPFTGFPVWLGVVIGVVLLGLGMAISLVAGRETEREVSP
jgi:hypothetical protein